MRKAIHFILFCPREKRRALVNEFTGWFEVAGGVAVLALLFLLVPRPHADNRGYVSGTASMSRSLEQIRTKELVIEPLAVWQTTLRKEDFTDNEYGRIFRTPHAVSRRAPSSEDDINITQLYGFEMHQGSRQQAGAFDRPKHLFVNRLELAEPAPLKFGGEDLKSGTSEPFFYFPTSTHAALRDANGRRGGGMSR